MPSTPTVLAAQGYTVRNFGKTPADVAATCHKIKAIGYDAVQVSGWCQMDAKELAKVLANEGLICCATHLDYARLLKEPEKIAEEHHILGCQHTAPGAMPGVFGGPSVEYPQSAEGYARVAREMSEVGRKFATLGLTLSYHNHRFEFEKFPAVGGRRGIDILMEDSDAKVVNFELDTFWVQAGGADPVAYIKKCSGRVPLLHLKDLTIRKDQQIMAEIGEGNLNWPGILAAAKAAGTQWYIVEQDHCERDPFESLAISLKNLKSWGLK